MHKEGHEIIVLTGQPNYPEGKLYKGYKIFGMRKEMHNGYLVVRVPVIPRGKGKAVQLVINYMSFVFFAGIFGPFLLRKKEVDAVFVYAPSPILQALPAILIKILKKAPLISWVGDLWPQSLSSTGFVTNPVLLKIVESVVKYIYRKHDLLLVQSRTFIEPVRTMVNEVPIEYFPNPGESSFSDWSKDKVSEDDFKLKPGFNVVFAGNIGSVQSVEMILETAIILEATTDVNIYMFGNGSMSAWLEREIMERNMCNLLLPGRFPSSAMPGIFDQADVLLVSLKKDNAMSLTVPSKVQSYMASGKPIIAALDGDGARIVTEAGAGIASPAENAEALAGNILKLKNLPPETLQKMGKAGYHYYKANFDSTVLCRNLVKRIEALKAGE